LDNADLIIHPYLLFFLNVSLSNWLLLIIHPIDLPAMGKKKDSSLAQQRGR
jgi:hypothetical protein